MNDHHVSRTFFHLLFLFVLSVLLASCGGQMQGLEGLSDAAARYGVAGDPERAVSVQPPTAPVLLEMGCQDDVDKGLRWMIERAGVRPGTGGRFVIVRAADAGGYSEHLYYSNSRQATTADAAEAGWLGGAVLGLSSVQSLAVPDAAAANDPAVLAVVSRAQAVFIDGGDQGESLQYWKNSGLHRALDSLRAANIPIAGNRIGLALLGSSSGAALSDASPFAVTPGTGGVDPVPSYLASLACRPPLVGVNSCQGAQAGPECFD
jgi:hypothetical protein